MLSMNEAKALAAKNLAEAVGQQFESPTGAIGTILAEKSAHGKVQAELTCTNLVNGSPCTHTHVREMSDWHQCGKCYTCKKPKKGGSGVSTGGAVGEASISRPMKVLDTDTAEVRAQKEEFNRMLGELQAVEKAQREEQRAKEAAERKAKAEAERQEREAKRAAEASKQVAARLAKIREVAKEKGIEVSPATEALAAQVSEDAEELEVAEG